MGFTGKLEDKKIAQLLRRQGFSYKEILQKVPVSKDTISRWCKDIQLTETQKIRLINLRENGQKKGSIVAAENKRRKRLERIRYFQNQGKIVVGELSEREELMAGIALYAAEGTKTDGKVSFTNSDPRLIKFMMNWFKKYLKFPMDKFRGAIWIHEGLDKEKAKNYWSELSGIPMNQFHKTYIAKVKYNSLKIRKNIHNYGIFSIRVTDSDKHRRIMGWIFGLLDDKIKASLSPVAQPVEQVAVKNRSL